MKTLTQNRLLCDRLFFALSIGFFVFAVFHLFGLLCDIAVLLHPPSPPSPPPAHHAPSTP